MNHPPSDVLTVAELQRLLTQKHPGALLVPPRILRRVIKMDRGIAGLGLQVPHRKTYIVETQRLLQIADFDELHLEPRPELPAKLLLLPRPDRQRLAARDRATTLLRYWRMLFHARVHLAFQQGPSATDGPCDKIRSRILRIGLTEFDEAKSVLKQEAFLLPPGDRTTAYEEFAALYLELRHFAPQMVPLYFPACSQPEKIDAVLAEDVDAAGLFAETRLEGAPDPVPAPIPPLADEKETIARSAAEEAETAPALVMPVADAPRAYVRLLNRADKASARGNMVRAAIFRMRAATLAPTGQANPTRAAAQREMELFRQRLQKALDFPDAVAADWRQALSALLEPASRGIWPSESRMLYDLQKVCIDREQPVFAVDLVEWIVSGGRRPIKRLLPFHDSVRMVKHLRSALHRLTRIRIPEPIFRRLIELLIDATHHAEHRLRERLRPVLRDALDRVDLTPANIAEEVARNKVVEELIDLVVEHGFLRMSDLRDAIARNRLKLPDLPEEASGGRKSFDGSHQGAYPPRSPLRYELAQIAHGFRTFLLGDSLIRANRRLAKDLDGVYHRGEIYLRWFQRLSAAAFGTQIGRFLTLYLALPFGCSLALLKVWDEVLEYLPGNHSEQSEAARHINPYAFTLLGFFFLALFHITPFRRSLLWASVKIWHGLRWFFRDLPAWFLRLPWLVRILQSQPWLLCYQFVLKPLPLAVLGALATYDLGGNLTASLAAAAGTLLASSLLLNSRWGLLIEETAADSLMRTWQLIHADLIPGLVRWVIYLYRRLQEEVERLFYTVDEWLRFRPGDSRLSLVVKPVLGLIWFIVTYVFRMIFNLFVEPTFNPIKHFPTVTVVAKLLAPFWLEVPQFVKYLEPFTGRLTASMVVPTVLFLLPGLAGFLVWEFKENWRLYRANQSPTLRPEIIGHHGETMLRLMRPGLHSGTLPKLYARLRHGRGRSPRKQYEALHHLRGRLRHFIERNLFAILAASKTWNDTERLRVGEIQIATNRIRIELIGPAASIHVAFEEHSGWLLAGLASPAMCGQSWLSGLTSEQGMAFRDALAGLYKLAGVDVVREQIASQLPPGMVYDLSENGLIVWPQAGSNGEVIYDFQEGHEIPLRSSGPIELPPLTAASILYSATPIHWTEWVQTWQRDHDGKGHAPLLPLHIRLLPILT